MMQSSPSLTSGLITLFGSGETSASGRKTWEWLFRHTTGTPSVAILETPAGFQPNSYQVAYRVKEFLETRLKNYHPQIEIIPARARESIFTPERADLLTPMFTADTLFLGAGSPTYAARQLEGSLAWDVLETRHQQGANVILASAAILAANFFTLPVYEIYKVGEILHWLTGLDFFSKFGLSAVFIPHWNNNDGGTELDTSRCFMGQERWNQLKTLLPKNTPIAGLDEHTSLILNPVKRTAKVYGIGNLTVEMYHNTQIYPSGSTISFTELGTFPDSSPEKKLAYSPRQEVLSLIAAARFQDGTPKIPEKVTRLIEARTNARKNKDWHGADKLRDELLTLGWTVKDTPDGPVVTSLEET